MCTAKTLRLIVVAGTPGTGKTTVAKRIAFKTCSELIESDKYWEELFPDPRYSASESMAVFECVAKNVEARLQRGESIIADGVFASRSRIELLNTLACRYHANFHIVVLHSSWDDALARMQLRMAASGRALTPKDRWFALKAKLEEWIGEYRPLTIDTTHCSVEDIMNSVWDALAQNPRAHD